MLLRSEERSLFEAATRSRKGDFFVLNFFDRCTPQFFSTILASVLSSPFSAEGSSKPSAVCAAYPYDAYHAFLLLETAFGLASDVVDALYISYATSL